MQTFFRLCIYLSFCTKAKLQLLKFEFCQRAELSRETDGFFYVYVYYTVGLPFVVPISLFRSILLCSS